MVLEEDRKRVPASRTCLIVQVAAVTAWAVIACQIGGILGDMDRPWWSIVDARRAALLADSQRGDLPHRMASASAAVGLADTDPQPYRNMSALLLQRGDQREANIYVAASKLLQTDDLRSSRP